MSSPTMNNCIDRRFVGMDFAFFDIADAPPFVDFDADFVGIPVVCTVSIVSLAPRQRKRKNLIYWH